MLILFLQLLGCTPTCEQTCDKLLSCEEISTPTNAQDCESSCNAQELLYEEWDDIDKREDFDEMKTCISDSECSEVQAGVCYEDAEDLYPW